MSHRKNARTAARERKARRIAAGTEASRCPVCGKGLDYAGSRAGPVAECCGSRWRWVTLGERPALDEIVSRGKRNRALRVYGLRS